MTVVGISESSPATSGGEKKEAFIKIMENEYGLFRRDVEEDYDSWESFGLTDGESARALSEVYADRFDVKPVKRNSKLSIVKP